MMILPKSFSSKSKCPMDANEMIGVVLETTFKES